MPLSSHASAPSATVTPSLSVTPPAGSIVVPDDYPTINKAIYNAPEGGTIFVRSGRYRGTVFVRKPLTLIGEDPQNTVIYVNLPGLARAAIEVLSDDVTISGFTIKDTEIGIRVYFEYASPARSRCKIIGNNIVDNFRQGIDIATGDNHVISRNNISGNGGCGITLAGSSITISENYITGNAEGLKFRHYGPYFVYGNNITDNHGYGIQFAYYCYNSTVYQNNISRNSIGVELRNFGLGNPPSVGSGNIVYLNNIVNNSQQVSVDREYGEEKGENSPYGNGTDVVSWDNGGEGNYWSDYNGTDNDGDGIGDTPYVIDENNRDQHPLMQQVMLSTTPPSLSEHSSDSTLTIAAIGVVLVTIFAIALFVYRERTKETKDSPSTPSLQNPKA